jgi:hypothetical protein
VQCSFSCCMSTCQSFLFKIQSWLSRADESYTLNMDLLQQMDMMATSRSDSVGDE